MCGRGVGAVSETTAILAYGEGLERVTEQHSGLTFVPAGDGRLSRLCRQYGDDVVLLQQFPEPHRCGRRRHWAPKRIGILVSLATLERARAETELDKPGAQAAKLQAQSLDRDGIQTCDEEPKL